LLGEVVVAKAVYLLDVPPLRAVRPVTVQELDNSAVSPGIDAAIITGLDVFEAHVCVPLLESMKPT
jgi:hypothetical protein